MGSVARVGEEEIRIEGLAGARKGKGPLARPKHIYIGILLKWILKK
jgi:hypothetical protein